MAAPAASSVSALRAGSPVFTFHRRRGVRVISASTTAAPTPLPTLSPSGTDLGAFTCLDHSGGANVGSAMQLSAVRVAHQPGFDRRSFIVQASNDPNQLLIAEGHHHAAADRGPIIVLELVGKGPIERYR